MNLAFEKSSTVDRSKAAVEIAVMQSSLLPWSALNHFFFYSRNKEQGNLEFQCIFSCRKEAFDVQRKRRTGISTQAKQSVNTWISCFPWFLALFLWKLTLHLFCVNILRHSVRLCSVDAHFGESQGQERMAFRRALTYTSRWAINVPSDPARSRPYLLQYSKLQRTSNIAPSYFVCITFFTMTTIKLVEWKIASSIAKHFRKHWICVYIHREKYLGKVAWN